MSNFNVGIKNGNMRRPTVPEWSAYCKKATRGRIRAVNRNSEGFNKIRYNRSKAVFRRAFNDAKKKSWEKSVSAINSRTSMKAAWVNINKISGKYRAF